MFVYFKKEQSARENKKVWIIGHIFPGNGEARDDYSSSYNKLMTKYNKTVLGQFFGHSHHDEFTFTNYDISLSTPTPSSVIYIAPSITPQSVQNPSARIYVYNRTSFEVLDMITYYIDLEEANRIEKANLKYHYSFKQTYKMADLSLASWVDFSQRLAEDPALWNTWLQLYSGNVTHYDCDSSCQQGIYCQLIYSFPDQRGDCNNDKSLLYH